MVMTSVVTVVMYVLTFVINVNYLAVTGRGQERR